MRSFQPVSGCFAREEEQGPFAGGGDAMPLVRRRFGIRFLWFRNPALVAGQRPERSL